MMKGTASLQINLDFKDEEDYIKKMKAAYYLSPLIYNIFDNGPFFKGKVFKNESVRSLIWENCDSDRCGLIKGVFDDNLSYRTYAEFLLNTPPIIVKKGNEIFYTGNKLNKDIFNPDDFTEDEISHIFSMVFPDIRTKRCIEIRMSDSIPYPYNFGFLAMIKGLIYNQQNLDYLFNKSLMFDDLSFESARRDIVNKGTKGLFYGRPMIDFFKQEILPRASEGLSDDEKNYLNCLTQLSDNKLPLKRKILDSLPKGECRALEPSVIKDTEILVNI